MMMKVTSLLVLMIVNIVTGSIYPVTGPAHGWSSMEKMYGQDAGPFGWHGDA